MDNNVDVAIRFYEPGDDEHIVELLQKTFPKWNEYKNPLGQWKWKYIESPSQALITVAVVDDKIVGCNHALVFNAKLGSETSTLGYSDDLAVDIDYRGLGIWRKLRERKNEKYPSMTKYVLSTTVNPIVYKDWVKRKRTFFPFPVTRMMKTKDIDLQLKTRPMKNGFLVKLGYIGLKTLNMITNIFRTPIKPRGEFQITMINEFDEGVDSLWMKIKDDYDFILEKKHEYLNWRFTDNERGNHVKYQAVNGEEVLGYVVVEIKPGSPEGQIIDLIAIKDRLDVADALLRQACEYLDDLGVNTVYYQLVEGHPYQGLAVRHGFINTRSRPNISFDYSANWYSKERKSEIQFIKHTTPGQMYFNYATTV